MNNIQVGVKAFIKNEDGKYLLLKRNREKYPWIENMWDIVGGRMNHSITITENFKRELKEETELELLSELSLIFAQDVIFKDVKGESKHVVRLTYVGKTKGEPILDLEENTEYKWVSIEEMKQQENLDNFVKEILDKGLLK